MLHFHNSILLDLSRLFQLVYKLLMKKNPIILTLNRSTPSEVVADLLRADIFGFWFFFQITCDQITKLRASFWFFSISCMNMVPPHTRIHTDKWRRLGHTSWHKIYKYLYLSLHTTYQTNYNGSPLVFGIQENNRSNADIVRCKGKWTIEDDDHYRKKI